MRVLTRPQAIFVRLVLLAALSAFAGVLGPSTARAQTLVDTVTAERDGRCDVTGSPAPSAIERALVAAHEARCLMATERPTDAMDRLRAVDHESAAAGVRLDERLDWLPELRARALLHAGRSAEAARAFEVLAAGNSGTLSVATRARLTYYRGMSLEAAGRHEAAATVYRSLARRYPGSEYASRVALHVLGDRRTVEQSLSMGLAALEGRHYVAAEQLLTHAACDGPACSPFAAVRSGEATRYEAAFQLGFMLYRYRREHVARALPWLETIADASGPRRADARFFYARAVMRMERHDEARRAWTEFRRRHPADVRAEEAEYLSAWLYLDDDRHAAAVSAMGDYVARHPTSPRLESARWWLGWAHFRSGDCVRAARQWDDLTGGNAGRAAQARYWRAVCLSEVGRPEDAAAIWTGIRAAAPFSYFGVLSARRLGDALLPDVQARPDPEAARAPVEPPRTPAVEAADLGLVDEARLLAEHDPGSFFRGDSAARSAWELRVEADVYDWIEWKGRHRDQLGSMPRDLDALRAWQLMSPEFYRTTVRGLAADNEVPPSLLWAIMQKESSFEPHALSSSDAMGLMQVIPQTAEAIAGRLGERYVDGMLFEPYHSIRYGAWYLGALARKFDGQLPLAIAAYNAGPVAVEAWVDRNAGMPFDEFVEEISYDQARDYVRRVLTVMVGYEVASGRRDVLASDTLAGLFPLVIRPDYDDFVSF